MKIHKFAEKEHIYFLNQHVGLIETGSEKEYEKFVSAYQT